MTKIPSQLLKGTLEGALLMIIAQGETYGYAICKQFETRGFGAIPEGTVYPLLLKMQKRQLISATRHRSKTGPDRKYYRLTPAGEQAIADFVPSWLQLVGAMGDLMEDCDENAQR
ncbi:PadR family transcriptional regulator [Lacticaseibacillus sp. GG6-2]